MILYDNWTRAEISLDALEHNLKKVRSCIPSHCRVMAMVKADAYGHGAIEVARCLEGAGVDYFGVASIFEASSLRDAGITSPILIAGYTPPELTDKLIDEQITQCVPSVETGMSRYGIVCRERTREAAQEVLEICSMEGLNVEGIFTHFACSDDEDPASTMTQLSNFTAVLDEIEAKGVKNLLKHCANSAAVLKYDSTHFDMVRAGLALYGLEPVPGSAGGELIPAMTMKAPITQVKTIPAGTPVSYGMTFTAARETRVATVPVGYGDGYLRAYSGAVMTVHGRPAPVIGRICMDICMLDVTDIPDVQEGDEAVVFGPAPCTTPEDLAKIAGTINYEVVTGISKRVLRLYTRSGKNVARLSYI